ncbi:MAG: 30S ribosomal protein S16 [Clostridia bacterium]|nr:30S ribosomal protein S16 [Clostridia bacterium]
MAVRIRLRRMGAHQNPFYRIVVADSRSPRDGRCIEEIGYFNPMTNPEEIKLDLEKAEKWISNGAQPTERVKSIIKSLKESK